MNFRQWLNQKYGDFPDNEAEEYGKVAWDGCKQEILNLLKENTLLLSTYNDITGEVIDKIEKSI